MKLEVSTKGKYKVITIHDSLKVISDLTSLKTEIEKFLKQGEKNIAVSFSDASYLYSGAISVLVTCYRMVREEGGDLCLIEPQDRVAELLDQMNIDRLIDIYESEEQLLAEKSESDA
jgi:anti-sigma B factor antagonist